MELLVVQGQRPHDQVAMPSDVLGARVHHHVRPQLKGGLVVHGGKSVVHHKCDLVAPADFGDGFYVDHVQAGVGGGLDVEHFGLLGDCFLDQFQRFAHVDVGEFDSIVGVQNLVE